MRSWLVLMLLVAGTLIVTLAFFSRKASSETTKVRVPVLVELFTSEGCFSCPPADEVLMYLHEKQPVSGVEIITLSEHVDYWNQLGWPDPFSSPAYSARQREYGRVFGSARVYTPQMVVNGRIEFVGSDRRRALSAIKEAARAPRAAVVIRPQPADSTEESLALEILVSGMPKGGTADVMLAITEDNLESDVPRGENRGRSLKHDSVVRRLESLGAIKSGDTDPIQTRLMLRDSWSRENLRIVVFLQERTSRKIVGASVLKIAGQ